MDTSPENYKSGSSRRGRRRRKSSEIDLLTDKCMEIMNGVIKDYNSLSRQLSKHEENMSAKPIVKQNEGNTFQLSKRDIRPVGNNLIVKNEFGTCTQNNGLEEYNFDIPMCQVSRSKKGNLHRQKDNAKSPRPENIIFGFQEEIGTFSMPITKIDYKKESESYAKDDMSSLPMTEVEQCNLYSTVTRSESDVDTMMIEPASIWQVKSSEDEEDFWEREYCLKEEKVSTVLSKLERCDKAMITNVNSKQYEEPATNDNKIIVGGWKLKVDEDDSGVNVDDDMKISEAIDCGETAFPNKWESLERLIDTASESEAEGNDWKYNWKLIQKDEEEEAGSKNEDEDANEEWKSKEAFHTSFYQGDWGNMQEDRTIRTGLELDISQIMSYNVKNLITKYDQSMFPDLIRNDKETSFITSDETAIVQGIWSPGTSESRTQYNKENIVTEDCMPTEYELFSTWDQTETVFKDKDTILSTVLPNREPRDLNSSIIENDYTEEKQEKYHQYQDSVTKSLQHTELDIRKNEDDISSLMYSEGSKTQDDECSQAKPLLHTESEEEDKIYKENKNDMITTLDDIMIEDEENATGFDRTKVDVPRKEEDDVTKLSSLWLFDENEGKVEWLFEELMLEEKEDDEETSIKDLWFENNEILSTTHCENQENESESWLPTIKIERNEGRKISAESGDSGFKDFNQTVSDKLTMNRQKEDICKDDDIWFQTCKNKARRSYIAYPKNREVVDENDSNKTSISEYDRDKDNIRNTNTNADNIANDIILVTPNVIDSDISTEIIVLSDDDKDARDVTKQSNSLGEKSNVIFMSRNDIKEILQQINNGNNNTIQILVNTGADEEEYNTIPTENNIPESGKKQQDKLKQLKDFVNYVGRVRNNCKASKKTN